jgi:RNA polymerase-interacting CarD/CdnL/TRCF family regulator
VILAIGAKVVYPNQGPCRIESVIERVISGKLTLFYRLALLDNAGGEMLVPSDKIQSIGIRRLISKTEISKILSHLKKRVKAAETWKQRAADNLRLLTSGSPFDLAEVIGSLTDLREQKKLSPAETRTLERARRLLICEIAEATGKTKEAAEEQVDSVLRERRSSLS